MRIELAAELLAAGETIRIRAFGRSMTPAIQSGDPLVVVRVDPMSLRTGEVVLCQLGNHLVAHRIVAAAKGPRFLLRCDRWGRSDGWVRPDEVLGRVIGIDREGGLAPIPYHPLDLARRRAQTALRRGLRHALVKTGLWVRG